MDLKAENGDIEIDLMELFYLLRDKCLLIFCVAAVCAAAAFVYTEYLIQPLYGSTSQLYILTQSTSITSLTDLQVGTQLTKDYVELIKSRPVVEEVIENLKLKSTYGELVSLVTVNNPENTRILKIKVKSTAPDAAKTIADEFAEVSRHRISKIMKTDEPNVIAYGYSSDKPVNVHLLKNIFIAGIIGTVITSAVIIAVYMMNDTVQTSDDIEKYLGLNTLTEIPLKQDEKQGRHRNKKAGTKRHGKKHGQKQDKYK